MYILGLSAPRHDAAAALLGESGIEAAIEESKLVRSRHCSGTPEAAIRFCLSEARIGWGDIRIVAVASQPIRSWLRRAWFRNRLTPHDSIAGNLFQAKALAELGAELSSRQILREMGRSSGNSVIWFEHHLCHAASAFYASSFERALILTMDERGDGLSGVVAFGEGSRIRSLHSMAFPHSLGWVYSQVTGLLGFTPRREEHKIQWLSLYGDPEFRDVFLEMLRGSSNGALHLDLSYFNSNPDNHVAFSDKFYARLGLSKNRTIEPRQDIAPQIASSLQGACVSVVTEFLETWRQRTGAEYLCLGGGLFLNSLLVAAVEKNTGFRQIFVQPAAGNAGCALGAAWLAWHQVLGKSRQDPIPHMYWGPSYTADQVKQVLDNCKAQYRWFRTETEKNEETIRLLNTGKIVAWCQGAAEFGPRALGNRSLLASPWAAYVRENLNDYVKHREPFRPFAIAVTEEDCPRYFDCSQLGRFMATVGWAKPAAQELIKDFLLPGNCTRLHVVQRQANPGFWSLLKMFGKSAPAPFLVNTSFNLFGEPLVISPRDAVRSFHCSGIDALVIDGFVLAK